MKNDMYPCYVIYIRKRNTFYLDFTGNYIIKLGFIEQIRYILLSYMELEKQLAIYTTYYYYHYCYYSVNYFSRLNFLSKENIWHTHLK